MSFNANIYPPLSPVPSISNDTFSDLEPLLFVGNEYISLPTLTSIDVNFFGDSLSYSPASSSYISSCSSSSSPPSSSAPQHLRTSQPLRSSIVRQKVDPEVADLCKLVGMLSILKTELEQMKMRNVKHARDMYTGIFSLPVVKDALSEAASSFLIEKQWGEKDGLICGNKFSITARASHSIHDKVIVTIRMFTGMGTYEDINLHADKLNTNDGVVVSVAAHDVSFDGTTHEIQYNFVTLPNIFSKYLDIYYSKARYGIITFEVETSPGVRVELARSHTFRLVNNSGRSINKMKMREVEGEERKDGVGRPTRDITKKGTSGKKTFGNGKRKRSV